MGCRLPDGWNRSVGWPDAGSEGLAEWTLAMAAGVPVLVPVPPLLVPLTGERSRRLPGDRPRARVI
ncbi:MAG: hypothetical protein ACI9CA_000567 [Natronomonas sp.]|jgi:hypothetical protein